MRKLLRWAAALPMVIIFGVHFAAAGEEPGLVTDVQFRGNELVSTEVALSLVRVRVGDVYSREAVGEDVERLGGSGLFPWVDALVEEYQGGYRVIFEVDEAAEVKEVGFRGNRRVGERRLRGVVETEEGGSLSGYSLRRDAVAVESYYRQRGFPFAEVKPVTEGVEGGVRVVYEVSEGPRVRVRSVRLRGNESLPARKLRKAAKEVVANMGLEGTRSGFWILTRGRFDEGMLRVEAGAVEDFYRRRGWLDCRVGTELEFNEKKTAVTITMVVDEGPLYRVGRLEFVGNEAVKTEEILEEVLVKEGEPFSVELLEMDGERIMKLYGKLGYAEAEAARRARPAEGRKLDVVWEIAEGRRFKIGRVDIYGNHRTKDKVVRRELSFYPGEQYNLEEIEGSRTRLLGMGYFDRVEMTAVDSAEMEDAKDVEVDLKEGRTGELAFSVGVNSNLGLAGAIQLRHRNFDLFDWPKGWRDFVNRDAFVGGGQTLIARYEPGLEYHVYRLSFLEPYLMDSPVSLGVDLRDSLTRRRNYDEDRRGGKLRLGRRFGRKLLVELGYGRERVRISEIDDDAPSTIFEMEGVNFVNRLELSATWDARDRRFVPTSGYRLLGGVEMAGEFLGGDVDYLKETVSASFYRTLWETPLGFKHVAALALRVGHVEAIGDNEEVPFFERFYLGGSRSLRGFEYRGVGPVEDDTRIGGRLLARASVEYLFPLFEDALRGVVFVDAGNLVEEPEDFALDEVRVSAGFGIRFAVPFLGPEPILLDFGFPIKKEPEDETQVVSFGIAFGF